MELVLTQNDGKVTTTSLHLVEYINHLREVEYNKRKEISDFDENGNLIQLKVLTHDNVLKKAKEVLKGGLVNFNDTYTHPQNGQKYPMYVFPKREAMLMAMSYSYDIQAVVYDAWEKAEKALMTVTTPAIPNFEDPAEMAIAWANDYRAKLELKNTLQITQQKVEEALPKVEFFDKVSEASNVLKMGAAASLLGMGRTKFMKFLKDNKYLQYDNRPYAQYDFHGAGYFTTKSHYVSGTNELAYTSYVTPKGLQYLQKKLAK